MDTPSHPKQPPTRVSIQIQTLERMTNALQKANQLMERHLAAGEKTVPAQALYFILRDAGYGNSQMIQAQAVKQAPTQQQEVKPAPKPRQAPTDELHHNYGMRR